MKILMSENIKIINEVGKWKAISFSGLSHSLGWEKDYSCRRKRLKRLEDTGHLNGIFERRRIKY